MRFPWITRTDHVTHNTNPKVMWPFNYIILFLSSRNAYQLAEIGEDVLIVPDSWIQMFKISILNYSFSPHILCISATSQVLTPKFSNISSGNGTKPLAEPLFTYISERFAFDQQ